MRRAYATLMGAALALTLTGPAHADGVLERGKVLAPNHVRVQVNASVEDLSPSNFRLTEARAPDIPIGIVEVRKLEDGRLMIEADETLRAAGSYRLEVREPAGAVPIRPAPWAMLLTVIMSAALINNFVFTRYLGLCVFFGVSKKRDTAIGMGITFTMVMVLSGMLSWVLYTWIMAPLQLKFLQIIVFIGVVAFLVQLLDTVLKKTHPSLHRKFGIYLMLITTNCIIIAVPLLNASAESGALDALALAIGSGLGFAIALFLMSCARERLEFAQVPEAFKGLPIAFALTGLFALAFMGFAGLDFFG